MTMTATEPKTDVSQLFRVDGLVAVITGGGSGIGLQMARALAQNGAAKVYIVGRRKARLEEAAKAYPNIMIPLAGDVTSQHSLKQIAETVTKQVGYINLLIANAGMTGPTLEALKTRCTLAEFVAHAWATPVREFDGVYGLNCSAVYYSILAFLPLLDAGNKKKNFIRSQVVATASTAAFLRNPRAGFAYTSSKAALISMIKSFSSFCVPFEIRFNILAPGLFPSELSESLYAPFRLTPDKPITEEGAFSVAYQPAGRAGSDEDMAGAILFLTSRAGAFTNGSVMLLDGGKLATMPSTY